MHTSARRSRGPITVAISCLLLSQLTIAGDSVRRYGSATPGSGNIAPTIWVNAVPRPGDANFKLRVARTLGGTWAFPIYSTGSADVDVLGLRLLVDATSAVYGGAYFISGQGAGGGAGDIPLPLPNNIGLVGQSLYVQAFTLDDFAPNPLGLGATPGLRLAPALSAQLLVARALPGSPDPQSVIQLVSNRVVSFDDSTFADGGATTFAQGGLVALALDPTSARLRIFDTLGETPVRQSSVALLPEGIASHIVLTPNGARAYVLETGSGNRLPITAYDARAGATFGQAWPAPPIRLENVVEANAMVFTFDSQTGFVAAKGQVAGTPGSVSRIDVHPTSATFHQQLARIEFPGFEVASIAISADGSTLYVPLVATGRPSEIAFIDVATFTRVDLDPAATGVQNLGGERSRPRTPLPDVLGRVAVDPRGEEIYCASLGAAVRVNVAPQAVAFRRVTTITDNIPATDLVGDIVVNDVGDFIYLTTSVRVVEIEAARLWSLRAWAMTGAVGLTLR